tara:strand:- start:507 stop:854 length:348 start_codon:yes stop_codon:yes gene_type:complete
MSQSNNRASYGWIITEDYVASDLDDKYPSDVGLTGPRNISPEITKRLKNRKPEYTQQTKFKMLDGDGNLYYVGYIDGEYDLTEPLDDFGTPNAGAIYLKFLEKDGSWSSNVVEAF